MKAVYKGFWGKNPGSLRGLAGFLLLAIATEIFSFGMVALPTAAAPIVRPGAPETDYTLGAGDRLRLDIFQVEDLSGEYLVLVDGSLSLPLIGRLQVAGLTLAEVNQLASQRYAKFLRYPVVTIVLVQPRPLKVAIAGEVNSPGSYTITLGQDRQFPTITDLLREAGGITAAAEIRQVQVRRFLKGRDQILTVNLWDLLSQGSLYQDVTLRDGDTVIVPTNERIDPAETRQLAAASFGPQIDQPVNVAVVGEVNRPGTYQVEPEQINQSATNRPINPPQPPRLTQAIDLAGGIKPLADIRNIQVRRLTRSGSAQVFTVNLWQLLQEGDIGEDIILQDGDTIFIPTAQALDPKEVEALASASFAPDSIQVNVVGEVQAPGSVEVPPNTPLNQAILAAGGFNNRRANSSMVELVRLNPNGTVTRREITVDLGAGINDQNNPPLRSNDVIVVQRSNTTRLSDSVGTILGPVGSALTNIRLFTLF
ncbi:MAG: sugar ABC transporter substrate-binding protein [Chloroflexaceae bacterium]|nr:sugar ABC transporter substrate-binding protein [Chloroflexaceae bacterium]